MDEEQCEVQRKTAALVYLPMPLLSSSKDLNAGIIMATPHNLQAAFL